MQKTIKTGKPFRRQGSQLSGKKKLKKLVKKTALLFSPVKNHKNIIEEMRLQIEELHNDEPRRRAAGYRRSVGNGLYAGLIPLDAKSLIDAKPPQRGGVLNPLANKNELLKSKYETQLGKESYKLQQLNNMFEDNVKHSWAVDSERKKWVCVKPFTSIEINTNFVHACCSNYFKNDFSMGNAYTGTFEEVWNSDNAKKLRYSVSNGNFEYCNETYCNALRNPSRHPEIMFPRGITNVEVKKWEDYFLKTTPNRIHLSCDSSCNLRCSSCRDNVFVKSDEENEKTASMLENFVRPALRNCTTLSSLGNGEFFVSKPILQFYQTLSKQEFPLLKLDIITNGTLFNPERWGKLSNLKGMVNQITISIDAAEKETYEKLRRGGRWEVLYSNMEFISSLKVSNEINEIVMSFVVQKENFRQMSDYVALAKKWNADKVTFRRLKSLRTYSREAYIENDVFNKINSDYKEAAQILFGIIEKEKDIIISDNCIKPDQSVEE